MYFIYENVKKFLYIENLPLFIQDEQSWYFHLSR